MSDTIIRFGESLIQHGDENDRVYLMHLSMDDMPDILTSIDMLAKEHGYSKIFAKVPSVAEDAFRTCGYITEARIPQFFHQNEDGCFLGRYLSSQRSLEAHPKTVKAILDAAKKRQPERKQKLQDSYMMRKTSPDDASEMAALYRRVFETYPFPIHDPKYLIQTMNNEVVYFGIWHNGLLAALSSCEMHGGESNAEMTDFAVLPSHRGQNLALHLLDQMEMELAERHIGMAYTIARAYSFGMNITFAKAGYVFAGTLTNNTNISGQIESMNVWYKPVAATWPNDL